MALVPAMSGVCSVFGTFEMTSKPTKQASTKMVSSVIRSMALTARGGTRGPGNLQQTVRKSAGRMSHAGYRRVSDYLGRGRPLLPPGEHHEPQGTHDHHRRRG